MTTGASPGQITIGGDLRVFRIGYGAMKLTGDQVWGPYPDHGHAIRVLRGVVESGINLIDTADVYGPHENELLIKEALHPYPGDLVIATKGGFVRGGFDYSTDRSGSRLQPSSHRYRRYAGLGAEGCRSSRHWCRWPRPGSRTQAPADALTVLRYWSNASLLWVSSKSSW